MGSGSYDKSLTPFTAVEFGFGVAQNCVMWGSVWLRPVARSLSRHRIPLPRNGKRGQW